MNKEEKEQVDELAAYFSKVSRLKLPMLGTRADYARAMSQWWQPLREILFHLCDGDMKKAKDLVRGAVEKLDVIGYTIGDVNSIIKVARDIDRNKGSQEIW